MATVNGSSDGTDDIAAQGAAQEVRADKSAVSPARQESPRRIRVAWLSGSETLRRFGRTLQPVAIGLMDEMVDLVALCPHGADVRELPSPPLEIIRYARPRWWSFGKTTVEFLTAEIRKRKIELLHALEASTADLARLLARSAGIDYIVSTYSLGRRRRLGRLDGHASAVLAASESIRQELLKHHVVAAENIHLVRPGVYQVRRPTCFSESQHSIAIITGGQLDRFEAFEAVLRSFAELRARNYPCVFFVLGGGRAERQLRIHAEKLTLREELTFADCLPVGELTGIFKAADVYVSPVPRGHIDMYCLLAMAAGIPVLAAAGGAADFLHDGRTAILFTEGDSAELTTKLMALLDDRDSATALAASALEYIRRHHSPAEMVANLVGIYRHAAGQTTVGSPGRSP